MTECWPWPMAIDREGYGKWRGRSAHRVMWEEFYGPVPDGLTLDHLCRNRACVNPEHLDPVPIAVNVARGERATRSACAKGHPYTEENTYRTPGRRQCRACANERQKAYQRRKAIA